MNNRSTVKKINGNSNLIFLLSIIFLISSKLVFSQTTEPKKHSPMDPTLHHEVKEDDYIPDLRDSQERSLAYNYSMSSIVSTIVTTQVNVDANGLNIIGDAANEPSLAIDPNDRDNIVIGWRQFNTVTNNFRQAGYGYTTNGGQTWTFPGVIEPGIFRSDPVLDYDIDGNFYYNSLSTNGGDYWCKVFKSSTGGSTWNNGVFAQGGDKQWMIIDKTDGPGEGYIYSFWTSFYSTCYPGFFTRSTDGGVSFGNCTTIPNEPAWGTLTVGSNGNLYVAGTDGFSPDFLFAKSTNAQISGQTVTWDSYSIVSLDGSITYGIGPNPDGLGGQTQIAIDTSGGLYQGNLYLLCSVARNSSSDPCDVMFARSTNDGVSWSSPIKVNSDPGTSAYQWFGTMSVAPNGRIDVVWLDTRDHPGTYLSILYYSYSTDAGSTWSENEQLSDYFDPHVGWPNQNKMGDYFHMVSYNNGASLAWAGTFNGEEDVYYSFITPDIVPVELVSFTATVSSDVVILNWSTATELNNHGFEIERASSLTTHDQENWRTIGFVEGKGTTTEAQHYSFTDKNLLEGKYNYRLKQIDFDGSYDFSNVVEVEIAPREFILLQNYPNPFNPNTTISWQSPVSSWQTLKIYDILGNEVVTLVDEYKQAGKYSVEFDGKHLPSGIYYYRLNTGSFSDTKKLMLLK
jgi:hypothetical protein